MKDICLTEPNILRGVECIYAVVLKESLGDFICEISMVINIRAVLA